MIKLYLDNGEIIECNNSMDEVTEILLWQSFRFPFRRFTKSDNEVVIVNTNKIMRVEGCFNNTSNSEVDGSPYSVDIIVD